MRFRPLMSLLIEKLLANCYFPTITHAFQKGSHLFLPHFFQPATAEQREDTSCFVFSGKCGQICPHHVISLRLKHFNVRYIEISSTEELKLHKQNIYVSSHVLTYLLYKSIKKVQRQLILSVLE